MSRMAAKRDHEYAASSYEYIDTGSLCLKVESEEDDIVLETPSVDVQGLCRMCAKPCTVATSTSLLEPNPTLTFQLLHYFGIMVLPKDEMPSRVCHVCTYELQHWEELKFGVKRAQDYLKEQLKVAKNRKQSEFDDSDVEIFDEDPSESLTVNYQITPTVKTKSKVNEYRPIVNLEPENQENTSHIIKDKNVKKETEIFVCKYCDFKMKDLNLFLQHVQVHYGRGNPQRITKQKIPVENVIIPESEHVESDVESSIDHVEDLETNINDVESNDEDDDDTDYISKLSRKNTQKYLKYRKTRDFSPTNPYRCGFCPLKYNTSPKLAKHIQKHCTTNKYIGLIPCPYCKVALRKITTLIVHIEKHVKNPYKKVSKTCIFCDKEFIDNKNLEKHMLTHNDLKKYVCSFCNVSFRHKCQLSSHMEKHKVQYDNGEGTKEPTCGVCLQFFDNYQDVLKHTKEKHEVIADSIYTCGNCRFRCKEHEGLLIHISQVHIIDDEEEISIIHVKDKNTRCDICLKEFDNHGLRNSHYKNIHHKHKSIYDCSFCKQVFNDMESLKIHVNNVHKSVKEKRVSKNAMPKPSSSSIKKKVVESELKETSPKNKVSEITETSENTIVYESLVNECENGYPCGKCNVKFNDATSFIEHSQIELDKLTHKIIPCGYCGAMFRKIQNLLSHIEQHILNPDKELTKQCKICQKRCNNSANYKVHMRVHSDFKKYICKLCGNRYKHKLSWKEHLNYAHKDFSGTENDGLEIEEIEGNTIPEIIKAAQLAETETEEEKEEHYSCDICNSRYLLSNDLYQHYLQKHYEENQITCVFCSKLFATSENLLSHYEEHSNVKKHFCPTCGKGFKGRCAMTEHMYLHSMDRPFQCDKCIRSYRSRTTLYLHQKSLHGDGKNLYMCEYCSKQYTTKPQVKRHILMIHSGILPFQCSTCDKRFSKPLRLKEHEYTHTNIKPLHCKKCDKGFISTKHWRNHMRKVCKIPEADIPYVRPRFFENSL